MSKFDTFFQNRNDRKRFHKHSFFCCMVALLGKIVQSAQNSIQMYQSSYTSGSLNFLNEFDFILLVNLVVIDSSDSSDDFHIFSHDT